MKMSTLRWKGGELWQSFKTRMKEKWFMLRLTYHSLFFNEFTSCGTLLDLGIEPFMWCIEHFVRYLGPAFVTFVVSFTLAVIVVFYVCLLPHQLEESVPWTCVHLITGHYFLYCTIFYYFKAAFTDPGHPPEEIPETVSICKRCIAPKPPRSHHCSVCNKCVLKMDHHCPWLNNCIGHNNHRYFMLFCTYMWIGTTYASAVAYPLFKQHFYGEDDGVPAGILFPFYALHRAIQDYRARDSSARPPIVHVHQLMKHAEIQEEIVLEDRFSDDPSRLQFHTLVVYEFLLCSAVSVALFFMLAWHCRLVLRGETSVEYHINKKQAIKMRKKGLVYKNPYDFGVIKNIELMLGISKKSSWSYVKYVLLPSGHPPEENGLQWERSQQPVDRGLFLI